MEMESTYSLTYAHCRETALGRLMYSPARFGAMLAGDFLEALAGYSKGEIKQIRGIAELLRTHAAILWNIHVGTADKLAPLELWPFPWDKNENGEVEEISEEERKRFEDLQADRLKNF